MKITDRDPENPSSDVFRVRTPTSLYAKAPKVYSRKVTGFFYNYRLIAAWLLLGLYYVFPWLTWNGNQAVLFDLPNRKFHYFGITLWPQDLIYLSWLLIIAALALFFFTALAGRLWCGYACPQTVWTKTFLWMERVIEGDRNKRMKLDRSPLSARKIGIKASKHTAWLIFASFTGFTFVGYFTPIRELSFKLIELSLGPWETFWIIFYSFATYGNAGWLREQVCIYMCPYARFQSAMFDKDTLIIAYDDKRGEARGARKRSNKEYAKQGLGDCIDCEQCVHVCPTGIDIRDGLQEACIACAACIDVCDQVMGKMDYPKGLIKYTTEHDSEGKKTEILRPRIVIYGLLLLVLFGSFIASLYLRVPLDIDVIRDRNTLYTETSDDKIENVFTLKLLNKSQQDVHYKVNILGLEQYEVLGNTEAKIAAGDVKSLPIRVRVPVELVAPGSMPFIFEVESIDDNHFKAQEQTRFLSPME